jgi:ketosteroid isomerase-like protein
MFKFYLNVKSTIIYFSLLFAFSTTFGQSAETSTIDLQKARQIIDSLDKQFEQYYFNGDSIAVYNMYTKDASFGSLKGNDILSAIGKMLRNSIKNDTRSIKYTTTSLSTDSELLVELGNYEIRDSKGSIKDKGKYLVVWKQENGNWKLFRDIGL